MRVELDLFSGRPNPIWTLSQVEAESVRDTLAALPEAPGDTPATYSGLGYRGFRVTDSDTGRSLVVWRDLVVVEDDVSRMVKADAGEAAVVFDSGRVVAGYAWDVEPLPPQHPAPGPERERVVRDRIAGILEKLVRLRDGTFAFTLNQQVETKLAGRDLSGEMLPGGINPEELMLDLAKKLDEDRRGATAVLEASFAAPVEELDLGLEELLEDDPIESGPAASLSPARSCSTR